MASSLCSSAGNDYSGVICISFYRTTCLALLSVDRSYTTQFHRRAEDKGDTSRGTMSSPKVLAKLLQSLGSVTSNGGTVFTGLHSYKANYILFLLSIAYVDTYTLTEIANVSRCAHLFSLGLIISHLELIWCSKTCRSRLQ